MQVLIIMAKCFFCGRPTVMYVAGEPVCLECSEMMDAGKKPVKREQKDTPRKEDESRKAS